MPVTSKVVLSAARTRNWKGLKRPSVVQRRSNVAPMKSSSENRNGRSERQSTRSRNVYVVDGNTTLVWTQKKPRRNDRDLVRLPFGTTHHLAVLDLHLAVVWMTTANDVPFSDHPRRHPDDGLLHLPLVEGHHPLLRVDDPPRLRPSVEVVM